MDVPRKNRTSFMEIIKVLDGNSLAEMGLANICENEQKLIRMNLNAPYTIQLIHDAFLMAGANIIRTNTTHAFLPEMKKYYKTSVEMYEESITKAVNLANEAVNDYEQRYNVPWGSAKVIGSCGSFQPTESMTRLEIKSEYRRLIQALSKAGINEFCFEDIRNSQDADILIELLLENSKYKAMMMFKPNSDGFLEDNENFADLAIHYYNKMQVLAVGVSSIYPRNAKIMLNQIREKKNWENIIPLVVCTNKEKINLPMENENKWPIGEDDNFPAIMWADMGIRYIGGCLDVETIDIQYIRDELKRYNGSQL